MKIFATNKFKGSLDLSSKEDFHNKNPIEKLPFRVTIKSGQTITVDDKWYTLHSIQSALKIGYIEILDFKEQHVFTAEVKIPENHTINYNLTLVEILNRADYPQDAFEKINKNFIEIDNLISHGGGGATQFIQLADTPNTYLGNANSVVAVNNIANGLIFTALYVYNTKVEIGNSSNPVDLNVYGTSNLNKLTVRGRLGSNIGAILVTLPNNSIVTKYLIGGLIYDVAGSNIGPILIGFINGSTLPVFLLNGLIFDAENSLVGANYEYVLIGLSDGTTIIVNIVNGFIFDTIGDLLNVPEILIGLSDGTTVNKFVVNGIICDF